MISYKYKLYNSKHNKHLSAMLMDASFVWNHCLALHKRYYRMFGKFINANRLKKHIAKRYKMQRLHSQTVQEVIERLDTAYRRFLTISPNDRQSSSEQKTLHPSSSNRADTR